jgi:hypothetical protein
MRVFGQNAFQGCCSESLAVLQEFPLRVSQGCPKKYLKTFTGVFAEVSVQSVVKEHQTGVYKKIVRQGCFPSQESPRKLNLFRYLSINLSLVGADKENGIASHPDKRSPHRHTLQAKTRLDIHVETCHCRK